MNNDIIIIGWIILMVIFVLIEAATMGLATIWFAVGSLIALLAAFLGVPFSWQIALFLICSLLLLTFTRPIAQRYLKIGKTKTNTDVLIDTVAIVLEEIDEFKVGQVKVKGQIWSAISKGKSYIGKNEKVKIVAIEGVKLIVEKIS